ncbi:MAG: acyltransferase family protein [Candidatus Levyibacteriota bacterium]
MGVLRLLLALSVLIFHAGLLFKYNIANNQIAVLSFFIVSGFYMALILDKKYTGKKATFLFWSNRFLRIFPLYWLTLLIIFTFTLLKFILNIGSDDNAIVHYINWSPHTSPFTFGVNLINYIVRNLSLIVTLDYVRVNDSTPGYLLVQQAWTLQIELLFYVLAPFFARLSKKHFIAVFLLYVIGFFGVIVPFHIMQPTLLYQFLSNLIFFLLGMMSYGFLYKRFQVKKPHPHITRSVFFFFLAYLLLYNILPFKYSLPVLHTGDFFYFAVFIFSLPFIFLQTSASVIDGLFGKLSYPVYITHFFIIKLFSNIAIFKANSNTKTILIIVFTLIVSYLMVKIIEAPIDKIRQSRVKNS